MEILPPNPTTPAASPPTPTSATVSRADKQNTADEVAAQPAPVSRSELEKVIKKIRDALPPVAQSLQFSIDDTLGVTVVQVMDKATKEVIRQIPSKEALEIAKALDKLQGVLLRQKA